MYNLKEKLYISKALLGVIFMCMSFFFSAHSFATSDTYSAISSSVISAEPHDTQLGVDGDDSSDPPLYTQFAVSLRALLEDAALSRDEYVPRQYNYYISPRAPPYLH